MTTSSSSESSSSGSSYRKKVYTKYGDKGETSLLYGGRVSKNSVHTEAYGITDEAVSAMGLGRSLSDDQKAALAEIDSKMKAKVAETEIMFDQQIATERDPAKLAFIQQTRQEQIAKVKNDAEAEKENVRREA